VTGISKEGDLLYYENRLLPTVDVKTALTDLLDFLGTLSSRPVLIGHNIKNFDCRVLAKAALCCGLRSAVETAVGAFVDTLPLFKEKCPGLDSYTQANVHNHVLGRQYRQHNAISDAAALLDIFAADPPRDSDLSRQSFSACHIFDTMEFQNRQKVLSARWSPLVERKVISRGIASKAAGSGLLPEHLTLAFQRRGADGVKAVLSQKDKTGKVRVTSSKKIIDKIVDFTSLDHTHAHSSMHT